MFKPLQTKEGEVKGSCCVDLLNPPRLPGPSEYFGIADHPGVIERRPGSRWQATTSAQRYTVKWLGQGIYLNSIALITSKGLSCLV